MSQDARSPKDSLGRRLNRGPEPKFFGSMRARQLGDALAAGARASAGMPGVLANGLADAAKLKAEWERMVSAVVDGIAHAALMISNMPATLASGIAGYCDVRAAMPGTLALGLAEAHSAATGPAMLEKLMITPIGDDIGNWPADALIAGWSEATALKVELITMQGSAGDAQARAAAGAELLATVLSEPPVIYPEVAESVAAADVIFETVERGMDAEAKPASAKAEAAAALEQEPLSFSTETTSQGEAALADTSPAPDADRQAAERDAIDVTALWNRQAPVIEKPDARRRTLIGVGAGALLVLGALIGFQLTGSPTSSKVTPLGTANSNGSAPQDSSADNGIGTPPPPGVLPSPSSTTQPAASASPGASASAAPGATTAPTAQPTATPHPTAAPTPTAPIQISKSFSGTVKKGAGSGCTGGTASNGTCSYSFTTSTSGRITAALTTSSNVQLTISKTAGGSSISGAAGTSVATGTEPAGTYWVNVIAVGSSSTFTVKVTYY